MLVLGLDCARDVSLDTKVITKHHRRNKKKTHTSPLFIVACFFVLQHFFDIYLRATSKLNSKTKQNDSNEQQTTLSLSLGCMVYSDSSRKCTWIGATRPTQTQTEVVLNWSTRSNQTQIQAPSVLGLDHRGSK
jgi:hypothetical protein